MHYRASPFAVEDPAEAQAVIASFAFATLVVEGQDGFVTARTPVVMEQGLDGRLTALSGHVARANPVWRGLGEGARAVALFSGPHAYVSASAYPSKARHGRAVPTWNYVAAEAHGVVSAFEDKAGLRALMDKLTDRFEAGRAQPWSVADAPADYVSALMKGIVGLRLTVREVHAVKKLSQNKAGEDFDAVAAFLDAEPDPGARQTAALMRELERG
ncbi:FMN-binding negative transcriptional regulator [Alkalicaulis satelles]|uniref:FMN-binding negative transcriptional regulator n=1 Tax=Alkalicaulis satelles TaxID=2609175 RepID=A0A5M6ZLW3_9PROT|nr:FMN-binding negative transcriptional regulator [Alkalicaulis satelles]KAA5805320.1 FMN-binding negative transcriptional regulator [Alkalicaulis satelles]